MLGYRPNRIEQLVIIAELEKLEVQNQKRGACAVNYNFIVHHVLTNREMHGKMLVQIENKQMLSGVESIVFRRIEI